MRMKAFLAACLGATAAFASTETDWSLLSGDVTVPVDETWYADEADMTAVNGLTTITVNGSLVFRDTTTVPKASLLAGTGTVHKTGLSVWANYANAQTSFTGDWHLDGGVVTNTAAGSFGKIDVTTVGKLYVHDGAALVMDGSTVEYYYRDLHIAGAGNLLVPRALVAMKTPNSGVRHMYLDDDATIETGPANHYWMGSMVRGKEGRIYLDEHTLTQYGPDLEWHFLGLTVYGVGEILFRGKGAVYRTGSWGGTEAGSLPFTFGEPGGSEMNFKLYNRPTALHRDLQVNVPILFSFTFNDSSNRDLMNTNYNHITGDVALNGTGPRLKLSLGYRNAAFTLSGTVSGDGAIQVGNMGNWERSILNLFGHNTYSGATAVTEKGQNGIMAAWPDSIPDYTKAFVTNGFLAARLGMAADGVTPRWTANDIWNAMNNITYAKLGHFSINAEECENATHEMSVSDIAANVPDIERRTISVAGGTLKLRVNAGDEQRVGLAADRGTLELVGGGTFLLAPTNSLKGIISLDNTDSAPIAEVRVTDGSTVVQSNEYVHVGGTLYPGDVSSHSYARLVVSNATWRTVYDVAETNDTAGYGVPALGRGAIWVGHQNRGILEIQNGGSVSNKIVVGGGSKFSDGTGLGAIYLSDGGNLYICKKGSKGHLASSIGAANYGYLQQTGGTLGANILVLGGYNTGVAHVYGGTAEFNQVVEIACFNSGRGYLYITNGVWKTTATTADGYMRLCSGGTGGEGYVTVDGPDAQLLLNGDGANINGAASANYLIRINVNHGGTLQFGQFRLYPNSMLNKAKYEQPCVLNVNGGIIKRHPRWSYAAMFGPDSTNRFSRIVVYEEGMTVDTTGKDVVQIAEAPFEGADGTGIMSIDLGAEVKNLIGAPRVDVENVDGGTGLAATAVAAWDPEKRILKGVHVTSHGWGYTQGKVKVTLSTGGAWSKTLTGDAITVGPNVSGGFTKRGEGTLSLNATNTWTRWTKVEGGTLKVNANWAIPPDTDLTISGGGILNFNGKTGEVVSVTYGAGGGSIINADNVVLPAIGAFTLDIDEIMAGQSIPFSGDLDLAGKALTLTGDLAKLDTASARRYTLIEVSGGIVSGEPTVVGDLPAPWQTVVTSNGVRLFRPCGAAVILR